MKRRQFCHAVGMTAVHAITTPVFSAIRPAFEPAYLAAHRSGEMKKRGETLWKRMDGCNLCPRECGARRLDGEAGFCGASSDLIIASHHPHFGEERPLVRSGGSGTIFFSHCALRCVFCINWDTSHHGAGRKTSIEMLSRMMLDLQKRGCHNINVVTPTHYAPHILLALDSAAGKGLNLPLVYNTCGWENMDVLTLLDGIVDIYLPDFKYAESEMAAEYSSGASAYPEITKAAFLEMHRQVGIARPERAVPMRRGLMIRHLVMPNHVENSKAVISWIAENLPPDTYLNIMSQYRPVFMADRYPAINRRVMREEYAAVVEHAVGLGLTNLDIQG